MYTLIYAMPVPIKLTTYFSLTYDYRNDREQQLEADIVKPPDRPDTLSIWGTLPGGRSHDSPFALVR